MTKRKDSGATLQNTEGTVVEKLPAILVDRVKYTSHTNIQWQYRASTLRSTGIVVRVWNRKLRVLLQDLDESVLGRIFAWAYVVEFQKRGLPQADILIILAEEDKSCTRYFINKLVSCKISDEATNPELCETVTDSMMHGPC
ncbi:Helitron helicase [Phytophthora megakarya]|uniref:Helitron helicase n=1 Tax=Phytophthora megakarya TaxID=4795 RepID=A0A225W6H5_9STRA|nr:Helitron helicase [Phytophthora megakarya]